MKWHGYPQHPDAHPSRPWWRHVTCEAACHWRRVDGHRGSPFNPERETASTDAELAAYDRDHPLPHPEPLCGQVLLTPSGGTATIIAVSPDGAWLALSLFREGTGGTAWRREYVHPPCDPFATVTVHRNIVEDWPRVYGPGSPWAPQGQE